MLTADFAPHRVFNNRGIYAVNCRVTPNIKGEFLVKVLNMNSHDVILNKRQVCGQLQPSSSSIVQKINEHADNLEYSYGNVQPGMREVKEEEVEFGEQLSSLEKEDLLSLINKHSEMFTGDPKNPRPANLVTHRILTDNHLPVKHKRTTVPHAWEKEVQSQATEMLKNGIIRPSSSPWNSTVLLIKKRDGKTRFVLDFRALNDVNRKDTYPLPKIQDMIDNMQGSVYWTTLDAASAYWSMPLSEEDKEKNCFFNSGRKIRI